MRMLIQNEVSQVNGAFVFEETFHIAACMSALLFGIYNTYMIKKCIDDNNQRFESLNGPYGQYMLGPHD